MAKICKPIAEYKDVITATGITLDNYKPPKKTIQRFIRLAKSIDDNRIKGMTSYPLHEVILIAFLAILSGAQTWSDISLFGELTMKYLKKFLKLENGIPSHDTFRRVFGLINPDQLEKITVLFLVANMEKIKKSLNIDKNSKRLICIDGKEQRGTGRKYNSDSEIKNLQTLHVYDASNAICLCSKSISSKTNEIPVAQEVLKDMQLKDAIVTFDALHTQKYTIQLIKEAKGDYVGALKGNHSTFSNEIRDYFSDKTKEKIRNKGLNYYKTMEKAHSQVETRRYYLTTYIKWFESKADWLGLKAFICYEKHIYNTITKKETTEIRYYITSLKDIELCADAIRGHWSVENQLHWHLDANLLEDDNTTTDKYAFNNFSLLNKMVLSLYKLIQPLLGNRSIRAIRKTFQWDLENNLALILNSFDDKVLLEALQQKTTKKK
jgi:predicted transposase YbfD/YdcC